MRAELARPGVGPRLEAGVRAFRRAVARRTDRAGWTDPETARRAVDVRRIARELPVYPPAPPPSIVDGAAALPLRFDPERGVEGISFDSGAYALHRLRETGGVEPDAGRFPLDPIRPKLEPAAERRLAGYLAFATRRGLLLGQLLAASDRSRPFAEALAADLGSLAGTVVARAAVLASARGSGPTTLDRDAIGDGIRATDAEWIDRPTVGAVL